ncbi:glutathione peroxidase [Gelidibacter sediminis]|uniref:Glutathione peroxidase n=1 Tax=Gelidibacter sediminis TaxID=1608710 RepID=A0A4R7PXX9_9FLAO|nr:glutathione peroxidase [Gelidibacter sediminis]TDU39833.1 glutathione peroxidase [Gelidibacter sediminis]
MTSFYDIQINSLQGLPINLGAYKGKYILIVNLASKCGFTPQYKDLQALYEQFKDQLVIIGVPCNQFGGQEPGDAKDINAFCDLNYGVSFLMTEKVDVKGKQQHPLYQYLTSKEKNGVKNASVKWNFQKYLIDQEGRLIDYFYSLTKPSSTKITKHLK